MLVANILYHLLLMNSSWHSNVAQTQTLSGNDPETKFSNYVIPTGVSSYCILTQHEVIYISFTQSCY